MGEKRNAHRIFVGKPDRKGPLGPPRLRWMDNTTSIKMDLREIGWSDMDWIVLAEDWDQWRAIVNMVMNLLDFMKYWEVLEFSCTTGGSSRRAQLRGVR
jgi:hypothetical protein